MSAFYTTPYRMSGKHAGRWWLPGLGSTEMVSLPQQSEEGSKFMGWVQAQDMFGGQTFGEAVGTLVDEAHGVLLSIPKAIHDAYLAARERFDKLVRRDGCIPMSELQERWADTPETAMQFESWWKEHDPATFPFIGMGGCVPRKVFEYWQAHPQDTIVPESVFGHEKAFAHTTLGRVSLFGAAAVAGYYVMKALTRPALRRVGSIASFEGPPPGAGIDTLEDAVRDWERRAYRRNPAPSPAFTIDAAMSAYHSGDRREARRMLTQAWREAVVMARGSQRREFLDEIRWLHKRWGFAETKKRAR